MQEVQERERGTRISKESLLLVPNPSPSWVSQATATFRFSRHLEASPPPWHSMNKSPSTLGHALSGVPAAFPRGLLLLLDNRSYSLSHAHPGVPPGTGFIGSASSREGSRTAPPPSALPSFRAALARGRSATRPSPAGESVTTPPLPGTLAVPSRLRLRSEPAGLRGLRLWEGPGVPDGRGRV